MNNMLSDKQINAVQEVIVDALAVDKSQITPESRLKEDLGADSIDEVDIVMKLEDEFELSLPDTDWDGVSTVGEVYEVLAKALGEAARTRS